MKPKELAKTFVLQQGQSDCGVACLLSIIKYHGGDGFLERLREVSGTSQFGTTLLGLYQASKQLGFNAEGMEAEGIDNLKELSDPAILHVLIEDRLQHYFVFYGFDDKEQAIIGDPAKGIVSYTKKDLDAVWNTKTLLSLSPNESFVKRKSSSDEKKKWILNLVKDDINVLIAAFFLGIVISILGLSTAILSQRLIDDILPSENIRKLILSLISVTILLLARSALAYLRGFFIIRQGMDFNNRIIQKFYGSLLKLPKLFFDTRKIGELIARMNDTRRIQTTLTIVFGNIIIDLLLVAVSTVFVFIYSISLGFVLFTCIPVYFLLVYLFNHRIIRSQKEVMASYALTESHYVDTIQGIATVKTSNREEFFENINKQVYNFFQLKIFDLGKLNIHFGFFSELIGVTFIILIFGISSWMVISKSLQLGEMVALLSMAGSIIPSMNRLAAANIQIQEAMVAFDRMYEFVKIKPEAENNVEGIQKFGNIERLRIANVSFRFPGRKELLQQVTMEINKGELIVLLGESGGGKSTLIQILQKFYFPETGSIKVNDVSLNDISTPTWRKHIGVVPQEVKIFNGSLLYNITLSDREDDFAEAIRFCQDYGFDHYFYSLPQNYLTLLGEEGVNISGGQKQLVAIARALFKRPSLLLLDEATSAMDRVTENLVLDLLNKFKNTASILFVTHRIKIAQLSDRTYILENGTITTSGSPQLLLLQENYFSQSLKELSL